MDSAALRVAPISEPVALRRAAVREVAGVAAASAMQPRPPAATIATGIPQVDALTQGLPRGALTEIFGPASSGRTSLMLSVMAQVTARGEVCALIDATDNFDPKSAQAAGVDLKRVLWVRCGKRPRGHGDTKKKNGSSGDRVIGSFRNDSGVEHALKTADSLLQAGGFGLVVIDLGEVPPGTARRVPLTSWFRFRRAVEHTPTALVVIEEEPFVKSAAALVLKLSAIRRQSSGRSDLPTHARLLHGTKISVGVVRSPMRERKPVQSVTAAFESRASWIR
ncbi:MAG: DNA recombination/repair protein RecA [Acidobacteriia bacterium]|nr:DNA recombination/repair protein RecA [Terriglobia bacterium]